MDLALGLIMALLVIAALVRIRRASAVRADRLTDEAIRRIEEEGQLERDDPLDFKAIEREHRRFFEETWDEPEEF